MILIQFKNVAFAIVLGDANDIDLSTKTKYH